MHLVTVKMYNPEDQSDKKLRSRKDMFHSVTLPGNTLVALLSSRNGCGIQYRHSLSAQLTHTKQN